MRIIERTEKDLEKWAMLTKDLENCVSSGTPLIEFSRDLNTQDQALLVITKPSSLCYRCIRDSTDKDVRGTKFVQFRTYKVDTGGFAGRRLFMTKTIISKHDHNPAYRLTTIGWLKSDTMRLAVDNIKAVLNNQTKLLKEPD